MTNYHTSYVLPVSHGQAIRKCHSEEHLPSSHKAEENLHLRSRSSSTANTLIPSFSKLGRKLKIRFETREHEESSGAEEKSREKKADLESRNWRRKERDRQETESKTEKVSLHSIKFKMSLVQAESPVSDLIEAQDAIKKLNASLINEKRLSSAKDTTIENLRQEINLLDEELVAKRKENDKYNEEMRKLRSKTTSLETENKILERQVKMMNDSNKRLHNELHELRNKLRIQETKVGELRVQRSEAVRKYAHLLQTSVDKSTRLRYFLQQLQNEILAHGVTSKKFQFQKEALENLMQEDSEEDLQFKKYGLVSPRRIRRSSFLLSEEEKESLRKGVEGALAGKHNKLPDKSLPIEKLTTATERIVTEGLKTRLGRENEESSQMSKLMQEAKHQIRSLDRIDSSHVETSKRLQDKVGTQLEALEVELKDLSDELRLAQISKREDEEKLRSITKFSTAGANVEGISLARRASQVEKLDLENAIHSMERKSEDSTSPMSPRDLEILSMQRKMAGILEEKLRLSDELIESRTSLSNLENLLESRSLENQKMEKELAEKEKRISVTETSLREVQKETVNLTEELETAKNEVRRGREEIAQLDSKVRDRAHRVELNFTPSSQPALEQKVETLKEELYAVRRNSITQPDKVIPVYSGVDKGVQVGDEDYTSERARRESPRSARRRLSLEITDSGHVKVERKISRTEVKLVKRADKEVQVEICNDLHERTDSLTGDEDLREKLSQDNQELKAMLEQQDRDMEKLEDEVKKLRGNKLENSSNAEDYAPFNYPKRVSELWKSLEEARQEKEEADKRNKELQDELERQEQEIQVLIKNLNQQEQEPTSLSELKERGETGTKTQNSSSQQEKGDTGIEQARSLMSVDEENSIDHEFVFDSIDGRRVPNEMRLEEASKSERNISMLESVIDSMRKDLTFSEEQRRELETELYRKADDLRRAEEGIEHHKVKLSEMRAFLDKTSKDKETAEKGAVEYKNQVTELNTLLEETRKEKLKAQEESERCKSQITELKESLDRTGTADKDIKNSIEEYRLQISDLKSSLVKTRSENQRTAQEILQRNYQIDDLKASLEDARKEYQRAEKEIERYKSEISELKSSLDETTTEKEKVNGVSERFKTQISELKASLDKSQRELSSPSKDIALCKSELSKLTIQLDKEKRERQKAVDETERYKSKISILEASLNKMKQENITVDEEIKKNKIEISGLKSLLEERKKENESANEDIERHKSKVADLKTSLEDAKRENSWNLKEIDRYKSEISDLKVSLGRSKKESANVTKEYQLYKFEISDLQASLEEERYQYRAAKKKIDKYESEISDLKSSLKKAREEKNVATNDIQRYKSQVAELKASVERERKGNSAATKRIEKYEYEISDLKSSSNDIERCKSLISDLEALLEKERQENQASVKKMEKYESEILDLKSSVKTAQDESRNASNDIERYTSLISELKALLEKERQENQVSVRKMEKYESEISDLKSTFIEKQETNRVAANDMESYEAQISDLKASLEETRNEKCRYDNENGELKREIEKLEERVQEFKMKEAEIKLERERLQTNNSELKITIDNLKNQLMGADKKMKDLESRAEEDNNTISRLMEEQLGIGRLQEQIKVLETKVDVRDKNLEQKVEEILKRDKRIEQISREKEELEKQIQDISCAKQMKPLAYDTTDGETMVKVKAESLCGLPTAEITRNENMEDLQKEQLNEIEREKADLEETVQQLRNVKSSQEKELELLRRQIQEVERGVQDTERTLEKNAERMAEKEKELRELVNEKVMKTSQIESLEANLSNALHERDSTLAGK